MEKNLKTSIEGLINLLPQLKKETRVLARLIYLELAKGKPVTFEQLENISGYPEAQLTTILDELNYLEYDHNQAIVAYRGITLTPTPYRIEIDFLTEKTIVFSWCAFDALFLADLLQQNLTIFAECPSCHQAIKLTFVNNKNHNSAKYHHYMSFILPSRDNYNQDLVNSFCGYIHFYCDEICVANAPNKLTDIQFFSISDAMKVAKQRNKVYFSS